MSVWFFGIKATLLNTFILTVSFSFAQVETIDLDNSLGRLPFDTPFYMKKELNSDAQVIYVGITEVNKDKTTKRKKRSDNEYNKLINILKINYPAFTVAELNRFFPNNLSISLGISFNVKTDGKKKTLLIAAPPLSIGKYYKLHIVTKPENFVRDNIVEIVKKPNRASRLLQFDKTLGKKYDESLHDFIFENIERHYNSEYQSLENTALTDLPKVSDMTCYTRGGNNWDISNILEKVIVCPNCNDSFTFSFAPYTKSVIVNALNNLTVNNKHTDIFGGIIKIDAVTGENKIQQGDYIKRISTLERNINIFNKVVDLVETINRTFPNTLNQNVRDNLASLEACNNNRTKSAAYKALFSSLKSFNSNIDKDGILANIKDIYTNSFVYDLKIRNRLAINPDFGFIYYGSKLPNDFSTYLGFNINFKPINQDIPWSNYPNKSVWHYLSFHMGLTLNSIREEGKIRDFYNSNSINTGLAVRLGHVARINSGVLWFRKENLNPLIEDTSLTFSPYVGLSLDLSIKSLFNGIGNLFK